MKLNNVYIADICVITQRNVKINEISKKWIINFYFMPSTVEIGYEFVKKAIVYKKDDQYIDLKTKEKYKILDSEHCYPGNLCVKSNTLIPFEKCLNENHEKVKNNMFKRKILILYDQIQNGGNK